MLVAVTVSCVARVCTNRAQNNSWSMAIFCAIFYNGHPKFDHICIKLYRLPIEILFWPAKPKSLFSTLMYYLLIVVHLCDLAMRVLVDLIS